jgi:glycerol kinase
MSILAVDQGTSGTKAIVVDDDGRVLGEADQAIRPRYFDGGGVEVDANELLDSLLAASSKAIEASGTRPEVIALANQGETVMAWDFETGEARTPAIVWQDRRAQPICDELREHAGTLEGITGLQLDSYFSAPKMAWIRRNMTTDGVVTTTDTWLIHQLCGAFVTDVSTASRSMLLDLARLGWSDECLDIFGLEAERLPEIVCCDQVVGSTTRLGNTMAVGGLVVDQAAALLAQGCTSAGSAKCTFGTGAFLLANLGPNAVHSTAGLTTSVAWQIGSDVRYYMDGQVYAAGSALRWLQDVGVLSSPENLDNEAADDAAGVICVPSLAGLASPWWQPTASGKLEGLRLSTGRAQVVTAVLEGIAAQVAVIIDAIDSDLGTSIHALRADGGLTRSRRLMQAVADIIQRPVVLGHETNVTARGAAALGAASLGRVALGSLAKEEARTSRPIEEVRFEPQWTPDRAGVFRDQWQALVTPSSGGR